MASKTKADQYKLLNGKFLKDGEELIKKGDYIQASEKFWGAAAEMVKAVAAKQGKALRQHAQLWEFIEDLDAKHLDLGLFHDFMLAGYLHANFYEDELTPRAVREGAESVRRFVKKMDRFL